MFGNEERMKNGAKLVAFMGFPAGRIFSLNSDGLIGISRSGLHVPLWLESGGMLIV